ncbi:MAG: endonuclease/exonuclease/phosphatase family protein [Limibacillus sp.]
MELRLATFNLENLDSGRGADPPLEARIGVLRPQLLRLEADLLCLQEVNAQRSGDGNDRSLAALDTLLEETPYAGYQRLSTLWPKGAPFDKHNLVILSRWPLGEVRQLRNDLVPAPLYRPVTAQPAEREAKPIAWDRPLLSAPVTLPDGRRLHLINLHLRAPLAAAVEGQKSGPFSWKSAGGWAEGFYLAALKRSGQALEARLLVEALLDREPEALVAVCGDLNAEEQEMPLRILRADIDDSGNGALAPRVLTPVERNLPDWRRYSVIHAGRKTMLDHILVSRALLSAFRDIELHNEALGDELAAYASLNHSPESFHAPLVARFSL